MPDLTKTVHIEDDIYEKLRDLSYDNRTSIREEVNRILRKKLKIEKKDKSEEDLSSIF